MKMTDSPGAIDVTPLSATASANVCELSSTRQPVTSTAVEPVLVISNQSAPSGLFPLDHGATSEMTIGPAADAGASPVDERAAITDKRASTLAIVRRPRDWR